MAITDISDAKAQMSALIDRVRAGEEIVIGIAGKPVAKLIKFEHPDAPRKPGALKGKIRISDDFDILPADLQGAFGKDR